MSNTKDHFEMLKMARLAKKVNEKKHEAHDRENLKKHLKKKFTTTYIGAISKFEEMFGQLWGIGKDESRLTEEERQWREIWDIVRTEILNNGNNQSRAACLEVDNYNIRYQKEENYFILGNHKELTTNE